MSLRFLCWIFCLSSLFACQSLQEVEKKTGAKMQNQASKAVQLAQEQLDAYNQRDLEAFLFPYSDSVKVFTDHELSYQSKINMRKNYASWFGGLDSLHCTLLNRISEGSTVVDHEEVYYKRKNGESNTFHAIAIYTIRDGKIQEVMFPRIEQEY